MEQKKSNSSLWQNSTFKRMFTAYLFSQMGSFLDFLAITVIVAYTWKTSPFLISLVPVMQALPSILFASWAGVLADRFPKRNLMIIADVFIAIMTLVIIFAPNIMFLLPLLFIRSCFNELFMPAQQALTRHVVAEEHLTQAVTLNGMVGQLGKIVGPIVGSGLLAVISPTSLLGIKVAGSLISALILMSIGNIDKQLKKQTEDSEPKSATSLWLEGFRIVIQNRVLWSSIMCAFITLMIINSIEAQYGVLFRKLFPNDPKIMGWAIGITGIGGIIPMLLMKKLERFGYGWLLGGGMAIIGIGLSSLGSATTNTSLFLIYAVALIVGIGVGLFFNSFNVLLQKETDQEAIGRIFGLNNTLVGIAMIVSPLIGGIIVELTDVSITFLSIGFVLIGIGFLMILFQRVFWGGTKKLPINQNTKQTIS